jgi:hypothetical protein
MKTLEYAETLFGKGRISVKLADEATFNEKLSFLRNTTPISDDVSLLSLSLSRLSSSPLFVYGAYTPPSLNLLHPITYS